MVKPLPPGTILQLMYLRERLKRVPAGRFVEIGPGAGEITSLLLELGWKGSVYDLEEKTIDSLNDRFPKEISIKSITTNKEDYLQSSEDNIDLVISCMVMEHLDDNNQITFMNKAASSLSETGIMIGLVPASPFHWNIEDDIAGHYRRYDSNMLENLISTSGWKLLHSKGLTYPISNLLFPISNFLVQRKENHKLNFSVLERTKQSGRRKVLFKTQFPSLFGLLLNRVVLYPFHLLQKAFGNNDRSMVLYFEAKHIKKDRTNYE